jgi:hypothetical protein
LLCNIESRSARQAFFRQRLGARRVRLTAEVGSAKRTRDNKHAAKIAKALNRIHLAMPLCLRRL